MSPQRALHLFPSTLSRSNSSCKEYRQSQTFSVTIKFLRLWSLFLLPVIPKAQKMMDALQNPNSSMTSSYRSCEKKNDSVQSHLRVEQLWQTGVLFHSTLFTFHLGIHPAWLKLFLLSEILLFPFRQDQNTAFYLERKDKEFSLC